MGQRQQGMEAAKRVWSKVRSGRQEGKGRRERTARGSSEKVAACRAVAGGDGGGQEGVGQGEEWDESRRGRIGQHGAAAKEHPHTLNTLLFCCQSVCRSWRRCSLPPGQLMQRGRRALQRSGQRRRAKHASSRYGAAFWQGMEGAGAGWKQPPPGEGRATKGLAWGRGNPRLRGVGDQGARPGVEVAGEE